MDLIWKSYEEKLQDDTKVNLQRHLEKQHLHTETLRWRKCRVDQQRGLRTH